MANFADIELPFQVARAWFRGAQGPMSLIAQTLDSCGDTLGPASCIEIMRKKCGALQRQEKV